MQALVSCSQLGFVRVASGQFGVEFREAAPVADDLLVVFLVVDTGHALQLVVASQTEDLPEDLFALSGIFLGEFVGPTLDYKGGIDESVVVHGQ